MPTDASITDDRRRNLRSTINWEIPDSWLTYDLTLTAEINADGAITESSTSNNSITRTLQTQTVPPICLKLRRTRTEAPVYEAFGPAFQNVINRFRTLTPAQDVHIYPQSGLFEELDCCHWAAFVPYPYWDKWEVYDDNYQMIFQLMVEGTFSTDLTDCGLSGGETHRVAMIHPSANSGSMSGYANYVWNVSFVKFEDTPNIGFGDPPAGRTLAQEVAHNYNGLGTRWEHVDCGHPDGLNNSYPYDKRHIGPDGPLNYYGYDPISRTVIPPTQASDYMSYCGPAWTSDYTWRGIMSELGATGNPFGPPPPAVGDFMMALGFINEDGTSAEVQQVIRIPEGTMPADHLSKILAQQDAATSTNPAYRLELRTLTGDVLGTHDFDVTPTSHELHGGKAIFAVLARDVAGAKTVLVKRRSTSGTIGLKGASPNTPVIGPITYPSMGLQINFFPGPITWSASDADNDPLLFTVEYSRDNGANWEVIAANTPLTSLPWEADTLIPGSLSTAAPGSSRIRIIASDGFNTAYRISDPFIVTNRAPMPAITLPQSGAKFAPGETIRFRGSAFDPENGNLDGAVYPFTWTANGTSIGSGQDLIVDGGFAPGTYTATLTVRDGANTPATNSITFYVVDGPPAPLDSDGDGIPDASDNCPSTYNPTQLDTDGDLRGDACDNCPTVANTSQADLNSNHIGDDCDVSRLYVNASVVGGSNDGSSWASAFQSLEAALLRTDSIASVTELWAAQGRYVPTARTNAADPRSATFRLRANSSIRGGFVGNETEAHEADPRAHPTILSGDVNNDDAPNFVNRTDNVYSVFNCASDRIIDGLIISGGNATGTSPSVGGGVHITSLSPLFRRCDFTSNQGGPNSGAGVNAQFGSPTFDHCRFVGNTVASSGAGCRSDGGAPRFLNCLFVANRSTGTTGARGGAIFASNADPTIINCTIVANSSRGFGGGVYLGGAASHSVSIVNSIIWQNAENNGQITSLAQIHPDNATTANVGYSCVQGGFTGPNISADPMFVDLDGPDNILGTLDDQAVPGSGSPANDAGSNTSALAMATDFDLGNQPRFANDPARADTGIGGAPIVDMGAYEFQPPPPCPADFNGDGSLAIADIFAFLNAWFSGSASTDFDGLNGLQVADIFAFLNAWFAGCP